MSIEDDTLMLKVGVEKITDVKWFRRRRYLVSLMTFGGIMLLMFLRTNLSIAIVQMTSNATIFDNNKTHVRPAEFEWTSTQKGFILSSFGWGFMFAPIGGVLANRFGAVSTFGSGLLVTAVLSIVSPFVARLHIIPFVILRVAEGVAEGVAKASVVGIFLFWAPPEERSRLLNGATSGIYIGLALVYLICGYVTQKFGWEWSFFLTGGLSLVWCISWFWSVPNSPENDRFISRSEKLFLAKRNKISFKKKIDCPWKDILASKAVWALINERFVEGWSQSFSTFCFPLFVKDLFANSVQNVGLLSAIPSLCSFISLFIGAFMSDFLRNHTKLGCTKIHMGFITTGQVVSIAMLILMITGIGPSTTFLCISIFRFFYGIADVSYCVLPLDIAQKYASYVSGLCFSALNVAHILNPIMMGYIVQNHSFREWKQYFLILVGLNIWGCIIFYFFGSGKTQLWAELENQPEKIMNKMENTVDLKIIKT